MEDAQRALSVLGAILDSEAPYDAKLVLVNLVNRSHDLQDSTGMVFPRSEGLADFWGDIQHAFKVIDPNKKLKSVGSRARMGCVRIDFGAQVELISSGSSYDEKTQWVIYGPGLGYVMHVSYDFRGRASYFIKDADGKLVASNYNCGSVLGRAVAAFTRKYPLGEVEFYDANGYPMSSETIGGSLISTDPDEIPTQCQPK